MRKYTLNEDFFEVIDSEEKAYVLGLLTADGCVNDEAIILGLAAKDADIVTGVADILGSDIRVRVFDRMVNGRNFPRAELRIYSKKMIRDLNNLGVIPRKSLQSRPANISADLERHYIRGLVDGDGWITGSGNSIAIGFTGCREMVDYFAKFATRICGSKSKVYPNHSIWSFRVTGKDMPKKLIEEIYGDAKVALERKQLLAQKCLGEPMARGWAA